LLKDQRENASVSSAKAPDQRIVAVVVAMDLTEKAITVLLAVGIEQSPVTIVADLAK
jgi:hypothetical protein